MPISANKNSIFAWFVEQATDLAKNRALNELSSLFNLIPGVSMITSWLNLAKRFEINIPNMDIDSLGKDLLTNLSSVANARPAAEDQVSALAASLVNSVAKDVAPKLGVQLAGPASPSAPALPAGTKAPAAAAAAK